MDALILGPALVAAFVVSLQTGKLALRLLVGRILRQRAARGRALNASCPDNSLC